jgi:hypothetical protein
LFLFLLLFYTIPAPVFGEEDAAEVAAAAFGVLAATGEGFVLVMLTLLTGLMLTLTGAYPAAEAEAPPSSSNARERKPGQ